MRNLSYPPLYYPQPREVVIGTRSFQSLIFLNFTSSILEFQLPFLPRSRSLSEV